MMQSADSGPLALPRDDAIGHTGAALPSFDEITAPLNAPGGRRRPIEGFLAHPLNPAEVAQARLFEEILRAEIARLEQLATSMENRWLDRRDRDDGRRPQDLVDLRTRIDEARHLLDTLQGRFLRPHQSDGRGPTSPSS
ncbi:hypothetical protein [Mycobacterium sp.]|uniref:hypothetical protein n=1 Tax=Mycobacterium sp. TaxID=1785 RepID=UPI003D6A3545